MTTLVCAALRPEARALARGDPRLRVARVGMGPRRAAAAELGEFTALVVAGVGGALTAAAAPGDVVVATEVRHAGHAHHCPRAEALAARLAAHLGAGPAVAPDAPDAPDADGPGVRPGVQGVRRDGARRGTAVRLGVVVCADHVVSGGGRARLAADGALAVDMESGPLAARAAGRPFAVVRVVVDTPEHPLLRPATLARGLRALRALRAIAPALADFQLTPPAEEVLR